MSSEPYLPTSNPVAATGESASVRAWPTTVQRTLGALVAMLGGLALLGWWFKVRWLISPGPEFIAMVPNTGLCFALTGVALMAPAGCRSRWSAGLAALAGCIASMTLLQHLADSNFGTDDWLASVWLADVNPHRGRMAPQTAVAFIGVALTFGCLQTRMNRYVDAAAHSLVVLVGAIGMLGAAGYALGVPLLYSWFQQTAMALNSTVGFVLLSLGLYVAWTARRRAAIDAGDFDGHVHGVAGSTFLISALVLTGLFGTVALAQQTEQLLRGHVQSVAANKTLAFDAEIAAGMEVSDAIGNRVATLEPLSLLNADPSAAAPRAFLQRIADSAVVRNTTAFALHGVYGQVAASAGTFATTAGFQVQLTPGVRLLWRDGYRLQRRLPLVLRGEPVGYAEIELRLTRLDDVLASADSFSTSGEVALCTPRGTEQAQCAPTRHRPQPFEIARFAQGKALPMSYALDGSTGIVQGRDYRDVEVLAAFRPLRPYALGLVAKADAHELYGPVRRQFQKIQALSALLVLVFAWLLPTLQGPPTGRSSPLKGDST